MIGALLLSLQAVSAAVLPAAPPPPKNLDAEVSAFIAAWTGDYASAGDEPDRRAVVREIDAPMIARRTIFVEVTQADQATADGRRIIFQRIIAFADDPSRVRNYAASHFFADPARRARLDRRPADAARLSPQDLLVFDPRPGACALNLFPEAGGFILTAHKDQCRVVSRMRPGFVFHPEFRLSAGGGRFGFFEQGFFETGEPVAPPLTYELQKVVK